MFTKMQMRVRRTFLQLVSEDSGMEMFQLVIGALIAVALGITVMKYFDESILDLGAKMVTKVTNAFQFMMMKHLQALFRDKRGTVYIDMIFKLLLTVILILMAINLFKIVIDYQNVTYTAKAIAKVIELEGAVTDTAENRINNLNNSFGLNCTYTVTDVTYFNASRKRIQFRDTFTVVVSATHEFHLLSPMFSDPITITIPMQATVSGMSEVYWKAGE